MISTAQEPSGEPVGAMSMSSSLSLSIAIVIGVTLLGALIAFVRDRRRYSGYRNLMQDLLRLRKLLAGELFRDGEDLVLNGTWKKLPTQLRFSRSENTPGLVIHMRLKASFSLFLSPRSVARREGGYVVPSSDEMFNARIEARSNQPTEARLFMSVRGVIPAFNKLCRSANNLVRITPGAAEAIDLTPPSGEMVRNATMVLDALSEIADRLADMPGADAVRIEPMKRERRYVLRIAIAAGVIATVAALLIADDWRRPEPRRVSATSALPPAETSNIPGFAKWVLVTQDDFDPDTLAWLQAGGVSVSGRIPADFAGDGNDKDVAYLLKEPEGGQRVVMLSRGESIYDTRFTYLGGAVRVPKSIVNLIEWTGPPPAEADGDGLLIVRAQNDPASGLVIFKQRNRVVFATPKNYLAIRLK